MPDDQERAAPSPAAEEISAAEETPAAEPPLVSEEPAEPAARKSRLSRQRQRRQRSVFQYIAILFAAAFVLLLFTYVMERRQNQQREEQIEDLDEQRVSAVQSLQGLYDENAALKEQIGQLQDQLETSQSETAAVQESLDAAQAASDAAGRANRALDWFWQIDEAYVRGKYTLCRELIASLEETGLQDSLPRESITDTDRYSPYDRYMEIREKVL